jgi:catechol 2,3-dioxygenase-like lactoylglutathione lyase family enzyme
MFSIHHVQLAMPRGEEEAARDFFGRVLGMDEVPKPPVLAPRGGAWFRLDGLEIHLGVEDDFAPARKAHPGVLTDDLAGLAARLSEAGIQITPDSNLPGFRRFYVDDCFGNRLEFLQQDDPT